MYLSKYKILYVVLFIYYFCLETKKIGLERANNGQHNIVQENLPQIKINSFSYMYLSVLTIHHVKHFLIDHAGTIDLQILSPTSYGVASYMYVQ